MSSLRNILSVASSASLLKHPELLRLTETKEPDFDIEMQQPRVSAVRRCELRARCSVNFDKGCCDVRAGVARKTAAQHHASQPASDAQSAQRNPPSLHFIGAHTTRLPHFFCLCCHCSHCACAPGVQCFNSFTPAFKCLESRYQPRPCPPSFQSCYRVAKPTHRCFGLRLPSKLTRGRVAASTSAIAGSEAAVVVKDSAIASGAAFSKGETKTWSMLPRCT